MSEQPAQSGHLGAPPPLVALALLLGSWLVERSLGVSGRLPRLRPAGLGLVLSGGILIAWSIWVFRTVGEGTPDPRKPPKRLVETGPYRFIRHPGYAGGLLVLAGIALLRRSLLLLALLLGFALWLRGHAAREEAGLIARFGTAYAAYQQRVPAWLPRLRRENR